MLCFCTCVENFSTGGTDCCMFCPFFLKAGWHWFWDKISGILQCTDTSPAKLSNTKKHSIHEQTSSQKSIFRSTFGWIWITLVWFNLIAAIMHFWELSRDIDKSQKIKTFLHPTCTSQCSQSIFFFSPNEIWWLNLFDTKKLRLIMVISMKNSLNFAVSG